MTYVNIQWDYTEVESLIRASMRAPKALLGQPRLSLPRSSTCLPGLLRRGNDRCGEAVLVLSMWEYLSRNPLTDTVNQVILLMRRRRSRAHFRR